MSRILPSSAETIKKFLSENPGVTEEQMRKDVQVYGEKKKYLGLNEDAQFYNYVLSTGKQPPKIKTSSGGGYIKIKDINPDVIDKRSFGLRGQVVRFNEFVSKKTGNPQMRITIADETGARQIVVFKDKVEDVRNWGLEQGKEIFLQGLTIHRWLNTTDWDPKISSWTALDLEPPEDQRLPPLETYHFTPLSDILIGRYSWVRATVVSQDKQFYIGCPNCLTGIKGQKPAVGLSFLCPKCGENYPATELSWTILVVADKSGNQIMRIPPSFSFPDNIIGEEIIALGEPNEREEFNVSYFKRASELKPAVIEVTASNPQVTVNITPTIESMKMDISTSTPSKTLPEAKKAALNFIEWFGDAPLPEIAMVLSKRQIKDDPKLVLKELMMEGLITQEGEKFKAVSKE
jgi:hypothetical protein